jgi:tetratricopeptide (TPR) repeat protein
MTPPAPVAYRNDRWLRKRIAGYLGVLSLLIAHGVLIGIRDPNYDPDGKTQKCYVLTRDGIKISNHIGIDADTGRECRLLAPQMLEKYTSYKDGRRPQLVVDAQPNFFAPASGEPIVWYERTKAGRIELFDLMGFQPQTGDELKPVSRQIVEEWREQQSKTVRRVPNRIDPERFGFFDPVTGDPKIWYWVADSGEYEFYDGPGFHPKAGDQLKSFTRSDIAAWRQAMQAVADRKKQERERSEQETRDRLAKEAAERQAAKESRELADRQAAEELQRQQQSGNDCDRLAANPSDIRRKSEGVGFTVLKGQADQAIEACGKAVQQSPNELRYRYQLARAYQFKDTNKAFTLFSQLVETEYPAAFDNLGGMYRDRNNHQKALQLYLRGADLDDADSMVALADLIDKNFYTPDNPVAMKLALLKRAAELGHAGAQKGFPIELAKVQQAQAAQENQRKMMEIFGQIVAGAIRR